MPTANELDRLAAAVHALRPDWPAGSIRTYLATRYGTTAYRDLAVAAAWIAADPQTTTPKRLEVPGPWWRATNPADTTVRVERVWCERHEARVRVRPDGEPACCYADRVEAPPAPKRPGRDVTPHVTAARQALEGAK